MSTNPYMRCTDCGLELTEAEAEGLQRCPRCKTQSVPMLVADDVTINVNWHELRILGMWAENYAASIKEQTAERNAREGASYGDPQRVVNVICGRIHAQHPDRSALTMTGELGELKRGLAEMGASGMEIRGFNPDLDAEPDLSDNVDP